MHFLLPLSEALIVIHSDCLGNLSLTQNKNIYAIGAKAEHFSILARTSGQSALHCAHYKRQFPLLYPWKLSVGFKTMKRTSRWPKSCTLSAGKTFALALVKRWSRPSSVWHLPGSTERRANFSILGLCCLLALHLMSWRVLLNLRICAQTTFRWHESDSGRWAEDNYLGGRLARLRCVHPKWNCVNVFSSAIP